MDSTSNLDLISSTQALKEVTSNNLSAAASPAMLFANRSTTTTGLTWGYYGGRFNGIDIANGTLVLTANSTLYLVAKRSDGVVSFSSATADWNNNDDYIRLYSVVTGSSMITSWQDFRQSFGQVPPTKLPSVNTQTSNYTVTASDANGYVRMNLATANTVTIPTDAVLNFPIGTSLTIRQVGVGATTVSAAGVTINNIGTSLQLRKQNSTIQLFKVGANEWDLFGDITGA